MHSVISYSLVSILGVLTHRCYFIYGEHHDSSPRIAKVYFTILLNLYVTCRALGTGESSTALATTFRVAGVYFLSLFSSIATYRLFSHKFKEIPGPILARLTKLYHVYNAADSKQYIWLDGLNKKYGDYVRTGPNEITIFNPKAVAAIHGPNSECTRADWYDNLKPIKSISHTRSRKDHDARRRVWDQGFSIKALHDYEVPILQKARLLEQKIREFEGKEINITEWFEYYAYDLMGLLAFRKSFDMLEGGKNHWVVDTINGGTASIGPFTGVPWFVHLIHALPLIGRPFEKACIWGRNTIRERAVSMSKEENHPDVISWVIEDAQSRQGVEDEMNWILGDFFVMCVAGTEPVTTALLFLFYHLASAPECIEKLRGEINTLTSYSDTIQLQALPYLNALIHETLRMHPSIPSGALRITPPQGLDIDGTFIPGGTTVLTPQYSIHRHKDSFVKANEFIPERWTTRPELIKDPSAFFAWGSGAYACVGKNLGLMEIRTAAVLLLDKFNITFAEGEDGTTLFKESKDCFSWVPGPLKLKFRERIPGVKTTT